MSKTHQLFLFTLFAVWISCAKPESEFTYFGNMGPDHWSEHFNTCSGKHQSPININDIDVINHEYSSDLNYTNFGETPKSATMLNNGHTVLVKMEYKDDKEPRLSDGPLQGKGTYIFQQLHFHWGENNTVGSEDRINNISYPMELHLVFRNERYDSFEDAVREDDGVAVLAAFYEISSAEMSYDYETFTDHLKEIHEPETSTTMKRKNSLYSLLHLNMRQYYSYIGSLTTPPCSEDVIWIDYVHPIQISSEFIDRFRYLKTPDGKSLTHNFRPIQPLNNREVYKITEKARGAITQDLTSDIALVNAWDDDYNKGSNAAATLTISSLSANYLIWILLAAFILNTRVHI